MQANSILKHIREQFRHHRFFTFLHLFGTTITVMIAIMILMDLDNRVHPGGPEEKTSQLRYITRMELSHNSADAQKMGGVNLSVAQTIAQRVDAVDHVGFSATKSWTLAKEYTHYTLSIRYTNSDFWKIFSFDFIEGNGYTNQAVENTQPQAVISKKLRDILFPRQGDVVGKSATINGVVCTITGVVENVSATCNQSYAEAWLPYSLNKTEQEESDLLQTGAYSLAFLLSQKSNEKVLQQQIDNLVSELNQKTKEWHMQLSPVQDSWGAYFLGYRAIGSFEGTLNNLLSLFSRILLIMLIPAINLISLNITGMNERSEEIAIRKTYGASNGRLVRQILFEQGALTLLAGILGLLLATATFSAYKHKILLSTFESTDSQIFFNVTILPFVGCLLIVFLLNIMGGLIPAMKISKLQPARALKGDLL